MNIKKANVYDAQGHAYCIELDIGGLAIPDGYCDGDVLDIFQIKHRVPDVWRYTVLATNGEISVSALTKAKEIDSKFADRPAIDTLDSKVIMLILESPHKDEYDKKHAGSNDLTPKAPAQGSTGNNINKYLPIVLKKIGLLDGCYSLVISNPIPYICSLGIFPNNPLTKARNKIRDQVWEAIWHIQDDDGRFPIQQDFMARYAKYQPEYVINCCTKPSTDHVTKLLVKHNVSHLYRTDHPAIRWNTEQDNLIVDKIL